MAKLHRRHSILSGVVQLHNWCSILSRQALQHSRCGTLSHTAQVNSKCSILLGVAKLHRRPRTLKTQQSTRILPGWPPPDSLTLLDMTVMLQLRLGLCVLPVRSASSVSKSRMPALFLTELQSTEDFPRKTLLLQFHRPLCCSVSIFSSIAPPSPSAMISCTLMVCAELLCTLRSWALRTQCLRLFSTHSSTWRASGKISAKTLQQLSYVVKYITGETVIPTLNTVLHSNKKSRRSGDSH